MLWWVLALWITKLTAEETCPLDCRCPRPMEIDCSGSGHLTLDPSLFSGQGVRQTRLLYLHENRLTTIDRDLLAWLGQLRFLTLHNNLLMTLSSEVFSGQRNLETLLLYNNALAVLPPKLFATLISLKTLSLASNRLNFIHPEQFSNNILLESLDLSKNELHSLPADFLFANIRLKELSLNDNLLETLAQECFLPVVHSLKVLNISGNHWLRPPLLAEFKHLDSLMMSRCNSSHISDLPMSISRLDVSYNLIKEIPANLPLNLQVLNFTGNCLETIPDATLFPEALLNLSLSQNKFRKLSPFPASLQFLWLDYAAVTSPLGDNIFAGAAQLRYLNLEGNQLTAPLGKDVFKSLSNLKTLILASNCLTTLDVKDFNPLKMLHLLNISNNPLRCDCDVKNTRDWARRRKIVVIPQICDSKQRDEVLEELECPAITTTTTTPSTNTTTITIRPTTFTASSTTAATTVVTKAEVLELQLNVGQLMLNQTKKDSAAPRMEVCSVLVLIAVMSVA